MDSWKDELDARDRVRKIATSLSRPRSVNWVSEAADVSWQTANSELDRLVEHDQLERVYPDGDEQSPRYRPDYKTQYLRRIRELVDDNTRGELRDEIAAIQAEIDDWKSTYDVESRGELEERLGTDALTEDDVRERNRVIRRWERNEESRKLLSHALRLYDDLTLLDAESSVHSPA